jgi:hypothetical protein
MDEDIFALINEECELNDEWEKERENDKNWMYKNNGLWLV